VSDDIRPWPGDLPEPDGLYWAAWEAEGAAPWSGPEPPDFSVTPSMDRGGWVHVVAPDRVHRSAVWVAPGEDATEAARELFHRLVAALEP